MSVLPTSQIRWIQIIIGGVMFCFAVLACRLIYVQYFQHEYYKNLCENNVSRTEFYAPRRGAIKDVKGNLLAITRDVRNIVINPKLLHQVDPQARSAFLTLLSSLTSVDKEELVRKSRFYRPVWGGTWVPWTNESGFPKLSKEGLPIYVRLTNGIPNTNLCAVCVNDSQGQVRTAEGEPIYTQLNSRYQIITNQYARICRNMPLETWQHLSSEIAKFPITNWPGYDKKTAPNYRALRTSIVSGEPDYRREYPNGKFMSHVLGYTKALELKVSDNKSVQLIEGADGVERFLNDQLLGSVGWKEKTIRRDGSEITSHRGHNFDAGDGLTIVLTLDSAIQQIVEEELDKTMEEYHPLTVSCVVAEVKTGRILAYAITPDYDPNHPSLSPAETWRNRIITDLIEPGSTFKVVSLCAALNEGKYTLDTPINCSTWNAEWGKRPRESNHGDLGVLTLEGILIKSSNVGFGKLGWILTPTVENRYIRDFGYRSLTGIMLPGERSGTYDAIRPTKDKLSISRVPIGQGIAVSQLQTTMAIGAVANLGVLMRPVILDRIEDSKGNVCKEEFPQPVRRVISEKTARNAIKAMRSVTIGDTGMRGTGYRADLTYHSVGGKTGTAQKAGAGGVGYLPGKYYASFVGFFPTEDPTIVMSVMVDEPKTGSTYGGVAPALALHEIGERVARYLDIPPDKIKIAQGKVR